jgi:hypothetical protein
MRSTCFNAKKLARRHDAMSADSLYLVPVFDVNTLACHTIAVAAPSEAAAVWAVLRNAAQLRHTGGKVERVVEVNEAMSVKHDVWGKRYQPARLKETAE